MAFDFRQAIYDALSPLGYPCKHSHTDAGTYPNITFYLYDYIEGAGADNAPVELEHYPEVDVWAKTQEDEYTITQQVLARMQTAGFLDGHYQELYESDTGIYHTACRFVYAENLQGG